MVGDGGKIGGPPGVPPPVQKSETQAPKSEQKGTQAPRDSFVKSEGRAQQAGPKGQGPVPLGREMSGSTDVLRLARENPAAARQLVATLASQSAATLSEIEKALAVVRQMMEKLAKERFSKEARKKMAEQLKKEREKIAGLKRRLQMGLRKMALLQQIAGKLGDPRLEVELDRILNNHKKLKSGWGKRHHLLSIGSSLFGDTEETPEHLRQVLKTEARGSNADELGETLTQLSPRAVIAELIARTIDGSTREESEDATAALRGEFGRPAQSYALLSGLFDDSLGSDPFGEDE
jgi:hypothetical protein